MKHRMLAFAALAVLGLPALAQNLKPGLWEMSQKVGGPEMEQAMAQMRDQMAAMPPAQRKQMEEMMARQGVKAGAGTGGGVGVKVCMTKDMVERNDMPANQGDCKTTSQQRSGSTMKMSFTCANPHSRGEGEYTFLGPEAFRSKTTVVASQLGKAQTTVIEGSGKWLGADCGGIKPLAAAKQ